MGKPSAFEVLGSCDVSLYAVPQLRLFPAAGGRVVCVDRAAVRPLLRALRRRGRAGGDAGRLDSAVESILCFLSVTPAQAAA